MNAMPLKGEVSNRSLFVMNCGGFLKVIREEVLALVPLAWPLRLRGGLPPLTVASDGTVF